MIGGGRGRGLLGGRSRAGLGVRSGRLLGAKGKAGLSRWANSAGGGAGILGRGLGKAGKKAARTAAGLAMKTKPGQRAASGVKAAKVALTSQAAGKGRWRSARKAARSALNTPRSHYTAWAADLGAAMLALFALLHDRWEARKARQTSTTTTTTTTTTSTTTTATTGGGPGAAPHPFTNPMRALGAGPTTTHTRTTTRTTTTIGAHATGKTRGSRHMDGGFPLATAAAEVNTAAASYEPGDMWTVAADIKQLPEVFASVALRLRTYTARLEGGYALAQPVVQELQALYVGLTQLAQHAQEVEPLFRSVHAEDLRRGENPRVGESGWNV